MLDLKGISTDRAGYEREAIDRLLDALDDHPLSVELVAPHLKTLTPADILRDYAKLLERFADDKAYEGRNKSLLASLEFSRQRLSESARNALPYLAWFEGGVFEQFLLAFAELEPEAWSLIRDELAATALIHVEEVHRIQHALHSLPPHAVLCRADATPLPASGRAGPGGACEDRFIAVYLNVMRMADNALRGHQPAAGMALVTREEANLRSAMTRAFARGDRQEGLADSRHAERLPGMAGRLRERDALTGWVREQMPAGGKLDEAACAAILDHTPGRSSRKARPTRPSARCKTSSPDWKPRGWQRDKTRPFRLRWGIATSERIYDQCRPPRPGAGPSTKGHRAV